MYLSSTINNILLKNRSNLLGKMSYSSFIKRLSISFKEFEDLEFKYVTYNDFDKDDYSFSGIYDWDKNKKYILMNLSNKHRKIELDPYDYESFMFVVSQVIQHETIHQDQWQHRPDGLHEMETIEFKEKRNESKRQQMKYLSDMDEIDAYGHDIAMEIKYFYPERDPYKVLQHISKSRKLISYNYYRRTFRGIKWDRIKKKLLHKTFIWLNYV